MMRVLLLVLVLLAGCVTPHMHLWEGSRVCEDSHDPCSLGDQYMVYRGVPCVGCGTGRAHD